MTDRFRKVAVPSEDLTAILNRHVGAGERVVHVESSTWDLDKPYDQRRHGWAVWIETAPQIQLADALKIEGTRYG